MYEGEFKIGDVFILGGRVRFPKKIIRIAKYIYLVSIREDGTSPKQGEAYHPDVLRKRIISKQEN